MFIARPPVSADTDQVWPAQVRDIPPQPVAAPPAQPPGDTFDQELDGIDLAELDSILEQDRSKDVSILDDDQGYLSGDEAQELDEADLDLDFEAALALDDDQVAGAEVDTSQDESEALDLDMDFELAGSADLQPADQGQTEDVDLDVGGLADDIEMVLEDFEDVLGETGEAESDMPRPEEVPEEDLSLDLDIDLEEETVAPAAEDLELELSPDAGVSDRTDEIPETPADDLDLGDLDAALEEEALSPDLEVEDEELELSLDEGDEIDFEKEDRTETSAVAPESQDDGLDLSGFDDLLDEKQEAEEAEPEDLELSLDDEAELDLAEETALETEKETETQAGKPAAEELGDDLDLAGLDMLLDEGDDRSDELEPEELELSLDEELELASLEEPALETAVDEKAEDELGGLEDLEFELDAEFEDKPVSKAGAGAQIEETAEADEELDLSDIEKMLEDDTLSPEPSLQAEDLDLAAGAEKWADEGGDDLELEADDEIDLTEIEAAIDSAEDEKDSGLGEDQELELDIEPYEAEKEEQGDELELELEMETDASSTDAGAFGEDTDEIDLSDLNLSMEEEKPEIESEIIDAGDIELEFQIEEEGEPSVIDSAETLAGSQITAQFGEKAVADEGDDALIEEAFAEQAVVERAPEKPFPVRKKKKGAGKFLIVILILALLGGGGYYGYDYAVKNNIQIPYLSDGIDYINGLINPKPKDPTGTAMLSTLEINSKFIENEKAGRIFVVTGKVRNGYSVPCRLIRLQGKLYTKGKILAKTEQSYAGAVISDLELAGQDVTQIKQRLNSAGGQPAALTANPGQALPFMVVFSDLPAELDEFAIELLNSVKVQ